MTDKENIRNDVMLRDVAQKAVEGLAGVEQHGDGIHLDKNACDFSVTFEGKVYWFKVSEKDIG
jgi:hypothetical protein